MTDLVKTFVAKSDEHARLYMQEKLIVDVAEAVQERLEQRGMSRSALAERLGTSRGYITQVLSGSRNMTLRTLADIAWALGTRLIAELEDGHEWTTGGQERVCLRRRNLSVRYQLDGNDCNVANEDWHVAA